MINSENTFVPPEASQTVHVSPRATGAALIALIAALVVCGMWFAFYMLVFLPRATP